MIEQFANNAESTLDGSIDDSVTSLDVVSAATFPSSPQFRLGIDNEIMLVTAVAGNTFTVTRGVEGTTADSHSNAAPVQQIFTQGAREKWREDSVSSASQPAAGRAGALHFNGVGIQQDDGVSWQARCPLFELHEPPTVSNWTWVNQEGATAVDQAGILLTDPQHSGQDHRLLVKSASATPYVITARFISCIHLLATNVFPGYGLLFRNSAGNAFRSITWRLNASSSGGWTITILSHASPTDTPTETLTRFLIGCTAEQSWLRIEDDGTDRHYYVSPDGIDFLRIYSEANDTTFVANQVGWYLNNQIGVIPVAGDSFIRLISWKED